MLIVVLYSLLTASTSFSKGPQANFAEYCQNGLAGALKSSFCWAFAVTNGKLTARINKSMDIVPPNRLHFGIKQLVRFFLKISTGYFVGNCESQVNEEAWYKAGCRSAFCG